MDASTAISDGCDGIILGSETAQGHYPVEAVRQFLRISVEAERCFDYDSHFARMQVPPRLSSLFLRGLHWNSSIFLMQSIVIDLGGYTLRASCTPSIIPVSEWSIQTETTYEESL